MDGSWAHLLASCWHDMGIQPAAGSQHPGGRMPAVHSRCASHPGSLTCHQAYDQLTAVMDQQPPPGLCCWSVLPADNLYIATTCLRCTCTRCCTCSQRMLPHGPPCCLPPPNLPVPGWLLPSWATHVRGPVTAWPRLDRPAGHPGRGHAVAALQQHAQAGSAHPTVDVLHIMDLSWKSKHAR